MKVKNCTGTCNQSSSDTWGRLFPQLIFLNSQHSPPRKCDFFKVSTEILIGILVRIFAVYSPLPVCKKKTYVLATQ